MSESPEICFAHVRGFEADVFISYASEDNETEILDTTPQTPEPGWVDHFHHTLERKLRKNLGEVLVWRDRKQLGINDPFAKDLDRTAAASVVIVPIVSRPYLRSEWCGRELELFLEKAEQTGKADRRVFPVIKQFVEYKKRPKSIQSVSCIDFFRKSGNYTDPLRPDADEMREPYLQKMVELAGQLTDFLERFVEDEPEDVPTGMPVFLADTIKELEPVRDKVKWELHDRKCRVLPDDSPIPLPRKDKTKYKDLIKYLLVESKLVVQMIPATPVGDAQDASAELLQLQNQMISANSKLVDHLEGASLEELKSRIVDDYLDKHSAEAEDEDSSTRVPRIMWREHELADTAPVSEPPDTSAPAEVQAIQNVYLLCEVDDLEHVEKVADGIAEQNMQPTMPLFGGEQAGVRDEQSYVIEHRQKQLESSDAFVVYYGQADDLWLQCNLDELYKLRARRDKAVPTPIVFVGEPTSVQKRMSVKYRKNVTVVETVDELMAALASAGTKAGRSQ